MENLLSCSRVCTYTEHGCSFKGDLVVVRYWPLVQQINRNLPVEGFGQYTSEKVLTQILDYLNILYPEGFQVLLSVPELVVELNQ